MPNSIALQTLLAEALDKKLVASSKTAAMEANASQVKYNGGNTFQFGKITFANAAPSAYNRNTGFANSDVTLTYEQKTFKWDLGDSFSIDAMDVDESNFLASATNVLGEYERTIVAPDVDKKRFAEIATLAVANKQTYAAGLAHIRSLISACLTDTGLTEADLVCYLSRTAYNALISDSAVQKIVNLSGSPVNLNGNVKSLDGVEIIVVDDSVMGNVKVLVLHREAPIAIVKHQVSNIFSPEVNQNADAWKINVRIYHTLEIKDNELAAVHYSE